MSDVRIEAARREDLPALVSLLADLFSIEQDFSPDMTRQEKGLALLLGETERATIQVARDGAGRVVGMATAQLVISTAEGAPSAWVEDVVVAAALRGQGIGRALLQSVLAWAASLGATRAQLLVDLDNRPALDFYRHLGWQPTRLAAQRIFLSR